MAHDTVRPAGDDFAEGSFGRDLGIDVHRLRIILLGKGNDLVLADGERTAFAGGAGRRSIEGDRAGTVAARGAAIAEGAVAAHPIADREVRCVVASISAMW
jgi:hypothetical protein